MDREANSLPPQAKAFIVQQLHTRHFGLMDYQSAWQAMQAFTDQRTSSTVDEIWFLQHPAVFTQGQAGKAEHLLAPGDIPVIQVDRGGQVTYHGPGQLVAYLMIDLRRRGLGVRELVTAIEAAIVTVLCHYKISASPRPDAPGVYIDDPRSRLTGAKIAQLGLRVRRGCSFHGLSLNVDMQMEPFQRINPCGHVGLEVANMAMVCAEVPSMSELSQQLTEYFIDDLGYTVHTNINDGRLPVLPDSSDS
ncbi:MAG: lipoyl(octanoyl) transferase LipB [Oceanicoccus sp.]